MYPVHNNNEKGYWGRSYLVIVAFFKKSEKAESKNSYAWTFSHSDSDVLHD